MGDKFTFNISLSVLNHLGRNLYRNLITVIGEAISNSWDADADNVWITIDRENNNMIIQDDGDGMTREEFQEKFLKIGYSKRKNGEYTTKSGRPYIGRKGIGKLALLSCAEKIQVATKTLNGKVIGGVINNSALDEAIKDDLNSQDYILDDLDARVIELAENKAKGTVIYFEKVSNGIINTIEYIQTAIALYFRFALIDDKFNIYLNDDPIDEKKLKKLAEQTQFVWKINDVLDPFLGLLNESVEILNKKSKINIKGYIASVEKPSNLKIRGTQEKVTIDLFVNGRLREKDILRHVPTARIVENYVYGQIHFDDLDLGNSKDVFTSSREGVIAEEPEFKCFLEEFERIFKEIIEEWDDLRRASGDDGDPDNKKVTPQARKAQELFNTTLKGMGKKEKFIKKDGKVEEWVKKLSDEAQFNIPSYTECFICENMLREYIKYNKMELGTEAKKEAERWKKAERENKGAANISYAVRASDDDLYYLDMKHLSNFIDKATDKQKDPALSRSAVVYKPVRDAVGHTSLITPNAKTQLSLEYENIKARLIALLKEMK